VIGIGLIDFALRCRAAGEQARLAVEHALGECELRLRLLHHLHGRDQVGLRLNYFRAVDLEQRIAALDLVADLGDQPGHAAGERCDHDGAEVLVEGNLPDRRLLRAKQIRLHRLDAQLVHLVDGRANGVDDFRGRRWRGGHGRCIRPAADLNDRQHKRNDRTGDPPCAVAGAGSAASTSRRAAALRVKGCRCHCSVSS
jgi:hypothetical protein